MTDRAANIHLGLLDDLDHEAKLLQERPIVTDNRKAELRTQALGAAISRKDWHAVEKAYESIRDAAIDTRPAIHPDWQRLVNGIQHAIADIHKYVNDHLDFEDEPSQQSEERAKLRTIAGQLEGVMISDADKYAAASSEILCEDEGCPNFGTLHVCISRTAPRPPVGDANVENDPRNTRLCTHPDCARYFSKAEGSKWFCRAEHCGLDHGFKAPKPVAHPSTDEVIRAALEEAAAIFDCYADLANDFTDPKLEAAHKRYAASIRAIDPKTVLAKVGK